MTFARVKPAGWAVNEVLTSAQANGLDINVSRALDGTAGGPYSPSSPLVIGGAGIDIDVGTVPSGGVLTVEGGGQIFVDTSGTLGVDGTLSIESGGLGSVDGSLEVNSGGIFRVKSTGDGIVDSGGFFDIQGLLKVTGAGVLELAGGREITYNPVRTAVNMDQPLGAVQYVSNVGVDSGGLHGLDFRWDSPDSDGGAPIEINWTQRLVGTGSHYIHFGLTNMIKGATLTGVTLGLFPVVATRGGLPATLPRLTLFRHDATSKTTVALGQVTDAPGSVGAYEAQHALTLSGLSDVVGNGSTYSVQFRGEADAGANAVLGLTILWIQCAFTVTKATTFGA